MTEQKIVLIWLETWFFLGCRGGLSVDSSTAKSPMKQFYTPEMGCWRARASRDFPAPITREDCDKQALANQFTSRRTSICNEESKIQTQDNILTSVSILYLQQLSIARARFLNGFKKNFLQEASSARWLMAVSNVRLFGKEQRTFLKCGNKKCVIRITAFSNEKTAIFISVHQMN